MKKNFAFILLLIVFLYVFGKHNLYDSNPNDNQFTDFGEEDSFFSENLLLIDITNDKILYKKNDNQKIYPASLTKLMTLATIINKEPNLENQVVFSTDDYNYLLGLNASIAGLSVNEVMSLKDMMYAMILPSGADAAIALSTYYYKNSNLFIDDMNILAKDLNMNNSHFSNVTGLHDVKNYSTLNDLYIVVRFLLGNPVTKDIITSLSYYVPYTNIHNSGITFYSSLLTYYGDFKSSDVVIHGGKSGYTPEAGECLITLFSIDNTEYILLSSKAKGLPEKEEYYHVRDAETIFSIIKNQKKQ